MNENLTYTVLNGQSLLDIAVQLYGSADMAVDIAEVNSMRPEDQLTAGSVIRLPDISAYDRRTVSVFAIAKNKPASDLTAYNSEPMPGGIEYMGIEYNFIVS